MYEKLGISNNTLIKSKIAEREVIEELNKVDEICQYNTIKVLNAFKENNICESDFNSSTGYGYNDIGRDKIEKVFSSILGSEDSLVRSQFISGSHALTVTLFALLRPNDTLLSITGKPYDTLDEVIGIKPNNSSLKSYGINYSQIDLVDDDFDYDKINEYLSNNRVKVIEIQRSKGYSTRKSINIDKIEKVVDFIKNINKDIIIMVDNCYCEFVEAFSPIEKGCDIIVGSLIKNLGGGISPNGAYVSGRKDLIKLVAERLTVPGQGKEVGPSLGLNKLILQGIYMAPSAVASSIKTAIFTSRLLEKEGYLVEPKYNDVRCDIVQSIFFNDPNKLINYCKGIQSCSIIDSNASPEPSFMPGYDSKIIMASGSFTQGSSIEISCDGPLRNPFIAYQQGGLTFEYGKLAVMRAFENINNK